MKTRNCVTAVGLIVTLFLTTACQETKINPRPPRKEAQEFDCRKHDKEKICVVPWKDKQVLYCYKGKIPRVVRTREECK